MKLDSIRAIANAVLYEGYILYPYRPSSIKNRQRWTFGGVFPKAFDQQGDASRMETQVLLRGGEQAAFNVHFRFLQVMTREVGQLATPAQELPVEGEPALTRVPSLNVDGQELLAWEEAIEREIGLGPLRPADVQGAASVTPFCFKVAREFEPVRDRSGRIVAALIRTSQTIQGVVEAKAQKLSPDVWKLTIGIENVTPLTGAVREERAAAQLRAFASTHAILTVEDGAFISLLDPPDDLREAAGECRNVGAFPVLVGGKDNNAMLASPIILYDHPAIAPESPGDLFDGTEIDEILTLRILAMTDAEKHEMASVDARARALLERTHALTAEDMARLHGVMRNHPSQASQIEQPPMGGDHEKPRLVSLLESGRSLCVGARVRLRPKSGGDIMDIALKDKIAVVEAIERDFEDRIHVAVTLIDDPGRDLGAAGFPGHRFFFSQEEIEPIVAGEGP
jgi:hydrogenase maturation protease